MPKKIMAALLAATLSLVIAGRVLAAADSAHPGCEGLGAKACVALAMTAHRPAWRSMVSAYIFISAAQRDLSTSQICQAA